MSSGDGVLPQYGNKYQMLTFVMCPGVNQVEQTTACVHGASINSTEEYQLGISGQVTRLHYDYRLHLLQDKCFFLISAFSYCMYRFVAIKPPIYIFPHFQMFAKLYVTSIVVFMIVPDSVD